MSEARLNAEEKEIMRLLMDECKTQEETTEIKGISTRKVQTIWKAAAGKMMRLQWMVDYSSVIKN